MIAEFKKSELIEKLNKECEVASSYQERRWESWTSNYELYRDYVHTNRLTQRQAVNYPLMKETIKTILSKIDDPPSIIFKCLEEKDKGKEKELVLNELWNYYFDKLNFEGLDVLDKKNVLLCGRSFKKLNFLNREFYTEVLDNFDVLVDPKVNPLDIETANWLIHQHIYKSLKTILADKKYLEEGKQKLKQYLDTKDGILKSNDVKESLDAKQERLESLGVDNFEEFGASDTIVELKEHCTLVWDAKKKQFVRHLVIYALDAVELFNEPLKDVIGVDFYPFTTWGDDIDVSDFWSDGPGDMVRVPNKILNIWLSQLLENRTLRNYGMYWFDATNPQFQPQSFVPKPFGQYPVPGDPSKVIKDVQIPDLSGSIQEMEFLRAIVERSTGATAIEKGVQTKGTTTLGEVELLAAKSAERTTGLAKAYHKANKEFAEKWYKIIDANVAYTDAIKLYKESFKGKIFEKEVKAKDWKSEAGYRVKVMSSSEQESEKTTSLRKWMALKAQFPENIALQRIAQRRILDGMDLNPEEQKEVEEFEKVLKTQQIQQPQQEQLRPALKPITTPMAKQPVGQMV